MTDVSKVLEDLRGAIEAENADMAQQGGGSRFTLQPLPQPGLGCLTRFLLQHNYANGLNISRTEVALVFGGQVVAKHPRFDYELEGDSVSGSAGAHNWIFLPKLFTKMLIGSRDAEADETDESFADRIWRPCVILGQRMRLLCIRGLVRPTISFLAASARNDMICTICRSR